MDERISTIEKELAVLTATQSEMKKALEEISHTLQQMLKLNTDTQVMRQRIEGMDRELAESFKRIHHRTDKLEETVRWISRTIVGSFITGLITLLFFAIKGKI